MLTYQIIYITLVNRLEKERECLKKTQLNVLTI